MAGPLQAVDQQCREGGYRWSGDGYWAISLVNLHEAKQLCEPADASLKPSY